MKGNIGLVAVTNHNYGSILQTYALQTVVKQMGFDTQIIRYKESKTAKIRRFQNIEYAQNKFKVIYKKLVINLLHNSQKHRLGQRAEAFCSFIDSRLNFSKECSDRASLTELCQNYNSVLLGSDQVWHPMNLLMDFFTLNFVPDNKRKGAYAPSFGVSCIPDSYKEAYKTYISRIDFISCRELAGVKLVKELTGRDVPMVCDPTILLTADDWDNCLSNKVEYKEKYIFCYFIGDNPNQRELVKEYAKTKGSKIVALLHIDEYISSDEHYADFTPYNVGPSEFLYLIKNAECVMTDSFHATVFSLLFHKEFYTFNRFENGKGNSTSSRIDSLLETVKQTERRVKNKASIKDLSIKEINYSEVDKSLEEFRTFSLGYLKKMLA